MCSKCVMCVLILRCVSKLKLHKHTHTARKHGHSPPKQVTDVIAQVRRRKCTWAGHVTRIRNNRWTLGITTWKRHERKIPRGRPARRCRDELDDYWKNTIWQRIAQDRQMWKQHAEALLFCYMPYPHFYRNQAK